MSWYCDAAPGHPLHGPYHDEVYGFPLRGDDALFELLVLELNQAGLSWLTILKKTENFQSAFEGFEIDRVAAYGEDDVARLMGDAGIIRNRLKIAAAIHNAQVIQGLVRRFGSFSAWLDHHHPRPKDDWVKLFKETFHFTGGEITNEFLMSAGYLPGAHRRTCPIYDKIAHLNPPWMRV
ncbi:MAG: DNA-3-methyladenine glycosylase I [Alphaproteobacteria bacterium]|jgi:DNA-3-methyladenine glycosylase I|nr:DNA-3-methyladenine glycosylase [Rhodospirillaceae bacterium]MDP6304476.1 DNA-3-methyladenine glycosylase I [Alphaproteobacteria bacterium]MDP7311228.1 DNA-3-methyladenine glycosylase I [Alphaproteobacteria bacterium]MDP7468401.1 DNA-3-methyladenine glycosylase I [Alphaproteobacteria bacterium]MDP7669062.1 DNA-3-methyladenine glycosylase I [Alphaproteobacteria bacterium]|tara:strand:+ start:682 stop:1218 length:537 start_codon:yes stop_codon:yes gene_type:complete